MSADKVLEIYGTDPRWQHDIQMWHRWNDERLKQEYLEMTKALFGMFKNNARIAHNLIAAILLKRGVTHIENIFKPIEIKII